MKDIRGGLWMWLVAGSLAGCFSTSDKGDGSGSGGPGGGPSNNTSALLFHVQDCNDLLSRIHEDVIAKVDEQATLLKLGEEFAVYGGGVARGGPVPLGAPGVAEGDFANAGAQPAPAPPSSGAAGAPSTTPSAPTDSGTGTSAPAGGAGGTGGGAGSTAQTAPTDYSETNVQVEGVDEADIVKTDGQHVYIIHGNDLFIVDSWPAAESKIETQVEIEGQALEMFVHEDRIVVFSTVWDQGDLIARPASDPTGQPTDTRILPGDGVGGGAFPPDYYYGAGFTKITVIDAPAGGVPSVARELFLEGNYLSARRHGETVRAVIQGGFHVPPIFQANIEYRDAFGNLYPQDDIDRQVDAWRDRTVTAVEGSALADWLPTERERIAGTLGEPMRRCTDFYAPPPGLAAYGLTNVVSFDLMDNASPLGGAIVLGEADEVYANQDILVLAHRDARYDSHLIAKERTVLHRFELTPMMTTYSASGVVPGHILDQFSIDETAGTIRVSTTQNIWQDFREVVPGIATLAGDEPIASTRAMTDNRVTTLQARDGWLVRVGMTDPLGNDGEQIKSSRFIGDMGYVVTFRQTDPLMAIDLSDPTHPTVLGELQVPGFSDYMHPLGDGYLLTIGRNTDSFGTDIGLLLQIFDVRNPTQPARIHMFAYGPEGYSEANQNHKAFTFFKPEGFADDAGLLAIPYVNYGYPFRSSLEVFQVSANAGFLRLGSIDHTSLLQRTCSYNQIVGDVWVSDIYAQCQDPEVRRGLFIFGDDTSSDYVYSVSDGGMLVHDMRNQMALVAEVQLPAPDYTDSRGVLTPGGPVQTQPAPPPSEGVPTPPPAPTPGL